MERKRFLIVVACVVAGAGLAAEKGPRADEADQAWDRRADGFDGEWAQPQMINHAIEVWEAALSAAPQSLEAHETLLRGLNFKGQYTRLDRSERQAIFSRGVEVTAAAMRLLHGSDELGERDWEDLASEVADEIGAGALHFWAAVHWGQWGDSQDVFAALGKGVAKRLRLHGLVSLELDPTYDNAGPYRLLGRLHAIAPRVPMVTGWVRRERAVELLEKAYELVPGDLQNRLFLIEIWLAESPEKQSQAMAMLETLVEGAPRSGLYVEDSFVLRDARTLLESLSPGH